MEKPENTKPTLRLGFFSIITVLVLISTIWLVPRKQVHDVQRASSAKAQLDAKERAELSDKYRNTLISSVGTVATALGGIFLFLNFNLARNKLEQDAAKISDDKKLSEARLTTERFTKAVEMLSSVNIHTRIGGIYSLKQLAEDSPSDYWIVAEVLTSFVREESPRLPSEKVKKQKVPADIQTVLTVISLMREAQYLHESPGLPTRLNLSKTDLRGINLSGANLNRLNLSDANLSQADLSNANLGETNLRRADLSQADLSGANLLCADLSEADLHAVKALSSKLICSNLSKANLSSTCLRYAKLMHANLREADLRQADLSYADLDGSSLYLANLYATQLCSTKLKNANLEGSLNATEEQIEKGYLCSTELPKNVDLPCDRDCKIIQEIEDAIEDIRSKKQPSG